jgi:hypothetical protein
MLLNYLETGNEVWFRANNGGLATIDSYRRFLKAELRNPLEFQKALRQNGHWEFIRKLPYYWETEEYFFSHAPIPLEKYWPGGLKPATTLPYPAELYCWATPGQIPEEKYAQVHPGKYAVCGHVHRLREQIFSARAYSHICYLDAGCGCHVNAPLAALILPERRIFYSL